MRKKIRFDASAHSSSNLRLEKITENDLALIHHCGIRDWNDQEFDQTRLLNYGKWVVNEDKSVIFVALGGGSFDVPEMYDLLYEGKRIRLECGGGGDRARTYTTRDDRTKECTVHARIKIPSELLDKRDFLLALIVEAFKVELGSALSGELVVEFRI